MPFMTSSAASGVMGFLTKGVGSKLVTYVVLIWVLAAAVTFITTMLPDKIPTDVLGGVPAYMYYFIEMFMLPAFVTTRISVLVTRWAIRRIPVIGG